MKEFVLNNWYYLFYSIVVIISIIISIVNVIKSKKANNIAEAKNEAINILKNNINELIKDAEKLKNYTGEEKKNYVLTRAIQLACGLMTNEEIDNYIETQVELTDNVNKNNH